jgi:hypothetical protein
MALDHRQDGLAARRAAAAEDHTHLLVDEEAVGQLAAGSGFGARVEHHRRQKAAVDAASLIDLGNREHHARQHRALGDGQDASVREEDADPDHLPLPVLAHHASPARSAHAAAPILCRQYGLARNLILAPLSIGTTEAQHPSHAGCSSSASPSAGMA